MSQNRACRRGAIFTRDGVGKDLAGLAAIDHPVAVEVRPVERLTQLVLRERLQAQRAEELVAREVQFFLGRGLVDRGEASAGSAAASRSIESAAARCESRRFSSSVDCGEASRRRARGRSGAGAAPHKRAQHDQFCCGLLQAFCKVCSRFEASARRGAARQLSAISSMNEPP